MYGKRGSQISEARPVPALAIASDFRYFAKPLKICAKCAGSNLCSVDPRKHELTLRPRALLPLDMLLSDSDEVPSDWDASTGLEIATSEPDDSIPKVDVFSAELYHFADRCAGCVESKKGSADCFTLYLVICCPYNTRKPNQLAEFLACVNIG